MRILAIDPGNEQSAYVILECRSPTSVKVVNVDYTPSPEISSMIYSRGGFDQIVCEDIATGGMTGRTTLDTAKWVGEFRALARVTHQPCEVITRKEIVKTVTGNGRAKDSDVTRALVNLYAPGQPNYGKGTKTDPGYFCGFNSHNFQALAVFYTWLVKKGYAVLREAA